MHEYVGVERNSGGLQVGGGCERPSAKVALTRVPHKSLICSPCEGSHRQQVEGRLLGRRFRDKIHVNWMDSPEFWEISTKM